MNKQIPYKTSRDYKRLKELLDKGYSIVCFIDFQWSKGYVNRDICAAAFNYIVGEYNFMVRGLGYTAYRIDYHKFTFEELCEEYNVEFIDIQEEDV